MRHRNTHSHPHAGTMEESLLDDNDKDTVACEPRCVRHIQSRGQWSYIARTVYYSVADMLPVTIVPEQRLTEAEARALLPFLGHCSRHFDLENDLHIGLLPELWRIFDMTRSMERPSDVWQEFGFQGRDPVTDFRASGVFGVTNLLSIAATHPALWSRITNSPQCSTLKPGYPVAIAGINITMMLLNILPVHGSSSIHNNFTTAHAPKTATAKDARVSFARLLLSCDSVVSTEHVFCEVYALAFDYLDEEWYKGDCNILNFNHVLLQCKRRMDYVLRDIETVEQIRALIRDS
eukprot:PhM_4_TR12473/c0_g1_i1/m.22647